VTTISAGHGSDTWVRDDHPNRNQSGGNAVKLQASHRRGLVHIPVTDIRGRTVLSATLTGHVRDGFAAQTVTAHAATSSWSAGKATWNNQPGIGGSVATALGALSDGTAADIDVTALLQAVANGTKWRGVRLTTSATSADVSNWYAFDASKPSWKLTIELSDTPEQPSDLRPNIGSVASSAPVLAWSYTDLGGDSSEQGAFKVQADPAADETTPAFDSGWVTSGDPQYDLSSGTFTPLASGASTQWRVMTRDAAGNESVWSDWAAFTYTPYATLTMDSPTGGVIGDSTPEIIAHLTGETLTQWRARVLGAGGEIRWDSGLSDGAIAVTVPKRNDDGDRVFKRDDATYTIQVRAWGAVDRAVAVGHPAYVQALTDVVFDDDIAVTAPDSLTLTPVTAGDPRTVFTWARSSAPDAWLIIRDGEVVERLDGDEPSVSAGVYTWTDTAYATPYVAENWTVRAVESGVRSLASNTVAYTSNVQGVWLIPDAANPIKLDTKTSIDQFAVLDRRAIYKPLNVAENVSIVYGFEGASGTFTGLLSADMDQATAVNRITALRADVAATPRLVWGISIPVQVSNLKVLPAADFNAGQHVYNVSFDFTQAGD
jgi:hypothetical protein